MEEKRINKNIVFSIIAVVLLIVAVVGATYAYFSATAGTDTQTVTTGTLTMGFTNGEILRATGITPIADSEIKTKATELPFSVTNTGNQHMKLTISLTDITISEELKDIDFRWGLYNADTGNGLSFGIFKNLGDAKEMVIYRDTIIDAADPDITNNYILRVWIHDDGALQNYMQGKSFSAKVTVDGEAIEYTPEECFTNFNKETGELNGRYDEDGNLVTAYDSACPKDVVIPRTIDGVTVTSIGDTAFYDMGITGVIVPNTVTSIDCFSFNNLGHVTIPENVKYLNYLSEAGITSLFIPENVTNLGFLYYNLLQGNLVIPGNVTSIKEMTHNNLSSVILMEGIKTIERDAFSYNEIEEIEIPSSVTSINNCAFCGNSNLTKIVLRGKTSIPSDFNANWNCKNEFGGSCTEFYDVEFRP